MTRLLNAAQKFLKVVHEFGYPHVTMKELAADEFYHQVLRGCLIPDMPEKFINEVIDFIKSHPWS